MSSTNVNEDYLVPMQEQKGLWKHSYNDDECLTHQFRVDRAVPNGWLAIASKRRRSDTVDVVYDDIDRQRAKGVTDIDYRVIDQYDNNKVVSTYRHC